jgi:hypothetical protein
LNICGGSLLGVENKIQMWRNSVKILCGSMWKLVCLFI